MSHFLSESYTNSKVLSYLCCKSCTTRVDKGHLKVTCLDPADFDFEFEMSDSDISQIGALSKSDSRNQSIDAESKF